MMVIRLRLSGVTAAILVALELVLSDSAFAQITPSGLGTTANSDGAGITCTAAICDLAGGSVNGNNWFLQFSEFSVSGGVTTANFNTPGGITNVISLVNGPQSLIDGVLSVSGASPNADLFLINPSGIVFGPNAQLNVQGSFIASTASSITFDNGDTVPVDVASTALLTVAVPVGLQFPATVNPIAVQAAFSNSTQTLSVPEVETFALVGGGLSIDDRFLTASNTLGQPGGRIELGSVGSNSVVTLAAVASGYELGYANAPNRRDITLSNEAIAIAHGGSIRIFGNDITLTQGSLFNSAPFEAFSSGGITVDATGILAMEGGSTSSGSFQPSGLLTENPGVPGSSGDITVNARTLEITNGAQINSSNSSLGGGPAGTITINVNDLLIEGTNSGSDSGIYSIAESVDGGDILIRIFDHLSITQNGQITSSSTSGNAGDITINTGGFNISDFGMILAETRDGTGGRIQLNANDVEIINNARMTNSTTGSGLAGTTEITADKILIRGINSGIFSEGTTLSTGDAGTISIDTISLTLTDNALIRAIAAGSGNGGNIFIRAEAGVFLDNHSQIDVSALLGTAGNITVISNISELANQSAILATTDSGFGGNIQMTIDNYILMRYGSDILTLALGNGVDGNITLSINPVSGYILGILAENSDIIAESTGSGGNLSVTANWINGFRQYTGVRTLESDFIASGTLELNVQEAPDTDALPTELSPENPIAIGCDAVTNSAIDSRGSHFVQIHRGGHPHAPINVPLSETLSVNPGEPITEEQTSFEGTSSQQNSILFEPQQTANDIGRGSLIMCSF